MDLAAIREGLAASLDTIPNLRVSAVAPDLVNPPVAVVWPGRGPFLTSATFDGAQDLQLTVTLLVAKADGRTAQGVIDGYLVQIEDAALADQTLGGTCAFVTQDEVSNYGELVWDGVSYLGAEIAFSVGT